MADLGDLTTYYQGAIEHLRVIAQVASERPWDEEVEELLENAKEHATQAARAMEAEWAKREADRAAAQWEEGVA